MNLAEVLLAAGAPDAPALRVPTAAGPSAIVRFGALAERALRLAAGLDVAPGARAAIVAGNEPAFVEAYLAILAAGAVAVPLNPESPPAELAAQLAEVDAELLVVAPARAEAAAAVAARRRVVVVDPAAGATPPLSGPVAREPTDPAALLFTSGTAGPPRAAVLTHGSLAANLHQVLDHPGHLALRPDDVVLGVLPLFHVFGLNVVLGLSLAAGASVVLLDGFDPAGSLARVRGDGVTVVAGVPALFAAWLSLDADAAPASALEGVRLVVSGAAALSAEVGAGMRERFGVVVREGYGLTEAGPIVTTSAFEGVPARPGSIGPPLPGVEVRLVDADGGDALSGDPGELWVRGANLFAGYWGDEDATARVLTDDGWLRTGDVAVADDDGWLRLVDRVKDLVVVSGFNVYPAEVEDVLVEHPGVAEAAVVGVPDPSTGEAVVASVVPAAGATVEGAELVAWCAARLARYKLPSRVEVVAELPRTLGGKVVRRALRADADDATRKPA